MSTNRVALKQLGGSTKRAERLAAVKQCQAAAAEMRTALAKVDKSYQELQSFHEAVRLLRKLIRQQEKLNRGTKKDRAKR